MRLLKGQRAQTAIEVAVFGAILIFALGAIIRSGVSRGNQQNALLKTTRMALTLSYDTSRNTDNASRNSASILVIEDRLTAGSGKYGPIDRTPTLMTGRATHTANIFMPVDFGDVEDLSVFDIYVNGQHITLSTAGFKTINLFPGGCPGANECLSQIWIDKPELDFDTTTLPIPVLLNGARFKTKCGPCPEIEPNCAGTITIGPCANASPCPAPCSSCSSTSLGTYTISGGATSECVKLYSIVDHYPSKDRWCDGSSSCSKIACSTSAEPGCNLSLAQRFDLDRNDLDSVLGDSSVPPGQWERFSWQWYRVMGFKESESAAEEDNLSAPPGPITINGLLVGEGINEDEGKNLNVDVDQDLQMEGIAEVYHRDNIIVGFNVFDNEEGDVNFAFSDRDQGISPGFTKDVKIYTEVHGTGTYLRIEEGKLFNGTQHIRTISKKDTVDLIERAFKLSNDTGRLCHLGAVQHPLDYNGQPINPSLEACGDCHSPDNITRTCMDPISKFLFIRSRIEDYHGHKWITDLSSDHEPYVEFSK